MKDIKLVVFDLDGTLLNTIDDLGLACNYSLERFGFPTHSLEEYKHLVGNGIARLIYRALPPDNRNEQTVEMLKPIFIEFYDAHCCVKTRPYDGIEQVLGRLIDSGCGVAVASNKYHAAAQRIVEHYFPTFNLPVWGQQDGVPTKPDPAIVEKILATFGVEKKDIVFVGDSDVDILTARNASVMSVGVSWGFRGRQELENAGANYVVDNVNELITLLLDK